MGDDAAAEQTMPRIGGGPLWFPGAAARLARSAWQRLSAESGLTPASYSTAGVLTDGGPAARQHWLQPHGLFPSSRSEALLVEMPSRDVQDAFAPVGLKLNDPDKLSDSALAAALAGAFDRLREVDSLGATLGQLVWSLHPIAAPDPAIDVGFSDPGIPFSIFVSIPATGERNADLRLAEGILHEGMHLQLTLFEGEARLVEDGAGEHFSPWMAGPRPAQGVLHGLYVFGVVRQVLRNLTPRGAAEQRYIAGRVEEAGREMRLALGGLADADGISNTGKELLRLLKVEAETEIL